MVVGAVAQDFYTSSLGLRFYFAFLERPPALDPFDCSKPRSSRRIISIEIADAVGFKAPKADCSLTLVL